VVNKQKFHFSLYINENLIVLVDKNFGYLGRAEVDVGKYK